MWRMAIEKVPVEETISGPKRVNSEQLSCQWQWLIEGFNISELCMHRNKLINTLKEDSNCTNPHFEFLKVNGPVS